MLNSMPTVEAFIEDAGNTGDDLDHPQQTNLFLGCLIIPCTRASEFWKQAGEAWEFAKKLIPNCQEDIELKGEKLYGGWDSFKGVALDNRCRILGFLINAVIEHRAYVFWEGIPKHLWRDTLATMNLSRRKAPLWKSALFAFCDGLYKLLDLLYADGYFRIICDENSWVGPRMLLQPPGKEQWPRLLDGGVIFESSAETRGLQIADVLIHTLYRANKTSCPPQEENPPALSNTDKLASAYLSKLEDSRVLFPLTRSREELEAKSRMCWIQERKLP